MKTKNLILKSGLLAFLFIVSLSVYGIVSAKEPYSSSNVIAHQEKNDFSLPVISVKDEPIPEILQFWMENGLYWKTNRSDEVENIQTIEDMMQSMPDGEFGNQTLRTAEVKNDLINSLKIWMQKGLYWNL